MDATKLIINKTEYHIFDSFNEQYSSQIVAICPLLNMFSVNIVPHCQTSYWQLADCNDNDAFCSYINKTKSDITSTYAEIMVNADVCNGLCLTNNEMMAGLAHEIGHIIMYFRTDKDKYCGQSLEINCDVYACRIGLRESLISLIHKLIDCRKYSDELINQMQNRLNFINMYKS